MEKYKVNVNGKEYYVEIELVDSIPENEKTSTLKSDSKSQNGKVVKAPMQGNIFNVLAAVNQNVKKGDVIIVLEAMKMENNIVAPCDGIIKEVLVEKGNAVAVEQTLFIIEEC